jgi:hypothetical protein
MKFRSFSILATLVCAVFVAGTFAQTSTSVTYKYTPIDYPGAASTSANGINNGNIIVGSYVDSSNVSHGFKYANGTFTGINFPGAATTSAMGISDPGDVVGSYQLSNASNSPVHGFLLHNGTFTTIDDPKTSGAVLVGINKSGTIVGNGWNGFVYQNGTFTYLNAPLQAGEVAYTQVNGINNLGQVVGQVFSGDNWRGFWVPTNGSDYDFFQPIFSLDNQVTGINGGGDIVGCHDFNNPFIAFRVEGNEGSESTEKFSSNVQTLPNPIGPTSCPRSINFARLIVGFAASHGYLAVPALTLNVTNPANKSTNTNPVHVAASASGVNPISQMQVWVNSKEVFHVAGASLNTNINLPVGTNERFVVQAVDSKGVTAKVVETITVH